MVFPYRPVDLLYIPAAGLLVEPVDVLRDDAVQPSGRLPLRQLQVRRVRLNGTGIEIVTILPNIIYRPTFNRDYVKMTLLQRKAYQIAKHSRYAEKHVVTGAYGKRGENAYQ